MADTSQILNVLLFDHTLTPEPGDYTGKVKLNGTWHNHHIAKQIVAQRSEYRYDTILSILNMADDIKRTGIATGHSIIDGVSQMRPAVNGVFKGKGGQFDPALQSKCVIMTPAPEMRKAMEVSKVAVLGVAPTGPVINSVEDVYTGAEDSMMTPGRNLRIYGQRLRIAGDDGAVVGVWFVQADDENARTQVAARDLVDNNPTQLTIIVPALPAGNYYLEVVTQSSVNSKTLTKEPRAYRFELILTVA